MYAYENTEFVSRIIGFFEKECKKRLLNPNCLLGLYEQIQRESEKHISALLLQHYEKLLEMGNAMAA